MTAPAGRPAEEAGGLRFRVVDAFTDEPFRGNPAAVFLLDGPDWPNERWMQRVALEMSVSESAFAVPLPAGSEADWGLRWFTPLVEDEMCGHATLATAHALHQDRGPGARWRPGYRRPGAPSAASRGPATGLGRPRRSPD